MKEITLPKRTNLENLLKDLKDFEKSHILNGTVAAALGDHMIYAKSFGNADFEANTPCTMETQYNVASVTKQFTAAALLRILYDANPSVDILQKTLQTSLSHYLPPEDFIWDGMMPEWAQSTTLHHLLTHTSGIVNYTELDYFWSHLYLLENPSMVDLVRLFKGEPLNFDPGTQYNYSNSGYVLLGQVIERLSRKTLSQYFLKTFFIPLNMVNTALPTQGTTLSLKKLKSFFHLARGYTYDLTHPLGPYTELKHYWPHPIDAGDGGIISTAPDLIKWSNALHKGHILPFDVLKLMLTPYNLIPGELNASYGYGIVCRKSDAGNIFTHGGAIPGYLTYPLYIPSIDVTIVSLSNVSFNSSCLKAIKEKLSHRENTIEKKAKYDEIFNTRYPKAQEIIEKHSLFKTTDLKTLNTGFVN